MVNKNPTAPSIYCYTTLSCETLRSAKQAINDKLQGLRCGGAVNNQIKKGLLLSLCTCALGHTLLKDGKKVHETITCNFAKY